MAAMSTTAAQAAEAQKQDKSTTNTNAAAVPRKRRRRAPATGASEDCFACRKRGVKCDRRRPYCGQCIEMGKECSGYRTTLTWGVGVASRGKLRGLSLPVAKSPPTQSSTTTTTRESKSQSSQPAVTSPTKTAAQQPTRPGTRGSVDYGLQSPTSPTSPHTFSAPTEYQYFGPTSPIPIPSPTTPMRFSVPGFGEHVDPYHPHSSKLRRAHVHHGPLQRLHTSLNVPYEENGLSASSASLGTYSDSDFPSPGEYPQTPADEFPFSDSMSRFSSFQFHDQNSMSGSLENLRYHDVPRTLPMADDVSSSISSDQSVQDFNEVSSGPQSMGPPAFPDIFIEGEMSSSLGGMSQSGFSYLPSEGMSSNGPGPLLFDELALTTSIPQSLTAASHLSPRMHYLLDFFANAICPVLVAGDGPTNPYRMHIMPLAMRSEGLRDAIAALSINNLRMRDGIDGRRLSLAADLGLLPEHAFSQMTPQELREMHGEASAEEKHHKAQSIALLNQKLADKSGAEDDSVLATLLILCLFHVCDSGFSKFRTQLAGVQKLLSMRDRSVQSSFVGWIEFFFTWFDVLTSAVNDRETEVQGDSLDMMNFTANLGASEHLSGCEGRLFKLIARLGRLNLLSQNRPVREDNATPCASPGPRRQQDFYSFNFNSMDGNGWLSPAQRNPLMGGGSDDQRTEFWNEWHEIRERLQEWETDLLLLPPPPPSGRPTRCGNPLPPCFPPADASMLHMSESFRYAALLYTERLAHPTSPPSFVNFQSLVSRGLFHINQIAITSCVNKFLLWPLFLIGTECVESEHRAAVRQRCVEIQRESGFFNNLSGLEVLEKVWQDDDDDDDDDDDGVFVGDDKASALLSEATPQQAFRWRKAMDRNDGEYIFI
ncbi:hypothetical protein P280DRAFT_473076 [Massarina eburnea CBS 473.64]|uniref:Zn(2)-C6 fungal-type domain-containing protein n=1 Tax=Massarina eburnea CBS 473.64 TaxID=1395130 RepID=A0A6A6RMN3_9PLEO|nr:hypothetical protein P280DRAFT_473076 [Massarina eburnea CBS 473.64]